jgi:transposase
VLTNAQWGRWSRTVWPNQQTRTAAEATTAISLKRCSGSRGQEARGAIFPVFFGNWNSVFKRDRDWVKAGVFVRLFEDCSDEPDMEYAMVDATIAKVHHHGQGEERPVLLPQSPSEKFGFMTRRLRQVA